MMRKGVIEELAAAIGGEATFRLVAVFGGGTLYVPEVASAEHPIAHVIGMPPFRHLVMAAGGETISVPAGDGFMCLRRMRRVVRLLADGQTVDEVAQLVGCSPRQVRNYRNQGVTMGLSGRRLPKD